MKAILFACSAAVSFVVIVTGNNVPSRRRRGQVMKPTPPTPLVKRPTSPVRVPVMQLPVSTTPAKRPASSSTAVGRMLELTLVNSKTDKRIVRLVNGTVIALGDLVGMLVPSFNINASVAVGGTVQSVRFTYNQIGTVRVDNGTTPFAFCGRKGTDFLTCPRLGIGNHVVTATPYPLTGGRGLAGTPLVVSFSVVQGKLTQRDPLPPRLVSLSAVNSTTVSISTTLILVGMKVIVQDDLAGVKSGFRSGNLVALDPISSKVVANQSFAIDQPVAGQPLTFMVNLIFLQTYRTGKYPLQLLLKDIVNNEVVINADALQKMSFPSFIWFLNPGFDDVPPKLLNFLALTPTNVNLANGAALVTFTISVQDDKSGFESGFIQAYEDAANFFEGEFKSSMPVVGRPANFNVSLSIPENTKPGKYNVDLLMIDDRGNSGYVSSGDLARLKFASAIDVSNPRFDKTPPDVLAVKALTPTTVDVSAKNAVVLMQISTRDNVAGVASGSLQVFDPSFSYVDYFFSFDAPVVGRAVTVNFSLPFPRFIPQGNYTLQLVVRDAKDNVKYLTTKDLSGLKFPSSIRVINSVVDSVPPRLLSFDAVSPMIVDLSNAVLNAVTLRAVVQDDLSGFKECQVETENLSTGNTYSSVFAQPTIANGSPVSLDVVLGFDQPGNHSIKLILVDVAENEVVLSAAALARLSFPAFFQVVQ